jgi:hypothetical protein
MRLMGWNGMTKSAVMLSFSDNSLVR